MATTIDDRACTLLTNFLDPVILVDGRGTVFSCNQSGRRLFGGAPEGRNLSGFLTDAPEHISSMLRLWAGSGTPRPATLNFRRADDDSERIRCLGSRTAIDAPGGGNLILIHCNDVQSRRLSVLTDSLESLRQEVRERRSAQTRAEEAARDRELMLRELQHRVKNNIQVITALVSNSLRKTTSREARAILEEAYSRLSAATAVQQLLYQADDFQTIDAKRTMESLISGVSHWIGNDHDLRLSADAAPLPNAAALPLALIANELITNSLKHGCGADGKASIEVTLTREDDRFRLKVADKGPGYEVEEGIRNASGLGLVRGLVRQLGGTLNIDADNGTQTTIEFEVED